MAEEKLKEYAGGWMTERAGTDVPPFLKYAFVVIGLGCVAYFIVYRNGDASPLVEKFNAATQSSSALMYGIALLAVVFVAIVAVFSFRKH